MAGPEEVHVDAAIASIISELDYFLIEIRSKNNHRGLS